MPAQTAHTIPEVNVEWGLGEGRGRGEEGGCGERRACVVCGVCACGEGVREVRYIIHYLWEPLQPLYCKLLARIRVTLYQHMLMRTTTRLASVNENHICHK